MMYGKQFFIASYLVKMSSSWKETLVILIPKINNPLSPSNFRPISLCMSIYKLVAKILLNRLMKVIHALISEEQITFIKGRAISDHVLLVQEFFHKFRFSKSKRGMVAAKLDMEQAYDNMAWDTLKQILELFGFPIKLSNLLMDCVTNPIFMIQVNGVILDRIVGKSGFRQGSPLSPYLFILCSQLLSNAFKFK
ncbi:integrator complex subunit 11 [Dendrobium catenatum]|uniref:Integrator complex subunit 11 n=1 Tax=Dendrobium catenatum TaxID=906689 RepID=A0A2I0VRG7_9ASPA|nr:integrator complex subunit 11 [Dendrobium catenatum]